MCIVGDLFFVRGHFRVWITRQEEEVISIDIKTPHNTHDMFAGINMGKYISFCTPAVVLLLSTYIF
jgi:hypothetical protein